MKTKLRENFERTDPLTWVQVHNALPLFTFIFGLIATFYVFKGNQEVLLQKQQLQELTIADVRSQLVEVKNLCQQQLTPTPTGIPGVKGASTSSGILKKVR